ncbi:MAG: ADP-ribose pyrophosphatase [Patescibacteria group bacterium]|nr:ADP-ribose pyrophosphatase [Patescibacteria group bacterium]
MTKRKLSNKKWKLLKSNVLVDNHWCSLRKDNVLLPNGVKIKDYYVSRLSDVAMVFAVTKDNKVVFVKQYRHPIGKVLLELPAGIFSKSEKPKLVAKRELLEETGYLAKKLIFLGKIVEYPTKNNHEVYLYLAKNVEFAGPANPEPTEDIELVLLPIDRLVALIQKGSIFVGGTISCIFKSLIKLHLIIP